jgi:hypothetical protein
MIARLWFVVALVWAAAMFFNAMTRAVPKLDAIDGMLIFGPFALGLFLRYAWRYVRFGLPRRY